MGAKGPGCCWCGATFGATGRRSRTSSQRLYSACAHYLADATYPQAAVAGLEYVGAAMDLMLPTEELRESGREVEQQINAQVQHRPEIASMLERLEEQFDQYAQERRPRSLLLRPDEHVPDAEEIGSVVETYLSGQAQQ